MSRASRHTPRSSAASHGRITTQNSDLVALLREKSGGPAPHKVSVDSNALDVVTNSELGTNSIAAHDSEHNHQEKAYVTSYHSRQNTHEPIVKSNSRLSLKSNKSVSQKQELQHAYAQALNSSEHPVVAQEQIVAQANSDAGRLDTSESTHHQKYSYRPLKNSDHNSRASRNSLHSRDSVNHSAHASASHAGDGENLNAQSEQFQSEATAHKSVNHSVNNNAQRSGLDSKSGTLVLDKPKRNSSFSHEIASQSQAKTLSSQPKPGVNVLAQNKNVENVTLNDNAVNVPKLDLSELSPAHNSPVSATDSESETYKSQVISQNLHVSEVEHSLKSPVLHFSAHDKSATGRTYEVDSPVEKTQIPHIYSSNNFRQGAGSQLGDQDTFREREQGPEKLTPGQSDLADDLKVPYPFDTQAREVEIEKEDNQIKPPSPPVQTTPPPDKEPATSLRSNSNVYAVSNPDILRAQGINPPPDAQFTPRQYSNSQAKVSGNNEVNNSRTASRSRYDQEQVRFDQSADQRRSEIYGETPVRDRVPTPFARSPKEADHLSPGELHTKSPTEWDTPREHPRKQGTDKTRGKQLPPQHPPLDTKPPSRDTNLKDDTISVKRVYVESPSFTQEEEDEYRFVSSRIDDIEDRDQGTFREMEGKVQRGYGGDDNHSGYSKAGGDYNLRERVSERAKDRHSYDERRREANVERDRNKFDQDRYEDRNRQMNGYSKRKEKPNDRNDDRNKYDYGKENNPYSGKKDDYNIDNNDRQSRDNGGYARQTDSYSDRKEQFKESDNYERNKYGYNKESDPFERQERYDRLQDERDRYEKERNRYPEEQVNNGYRKQNTEMDLEDLQKEEEYQRNLQQRIEYEKSRDDELVMPRAPFPDRDNYESENFARDSLDFPAERGRQDFTRDSLEYNGYAQQSRDWGQPPQNPFADYDRQPDFYDPDDAERMEVVHPPAPRVDYVEKNKQDYGFVPRKTYRDIVHKKKEENEKLDHIFITPKIPPKAKHKQLKKTQSAQPEHMGYQPPAPQQYPGGFKPSSAEELWAQRSSFLARKSSTTGSADAGKTTKSAGKTGSKAWSSNTRVKQPYTYQPPAPLPNQGQIYKAQNAAPSSGGNQGYTTPTRLQPIENKPQPPIATEIIPTAVEPSSPYRRYNELKPITQEILTDDGQRISVDINLRVISPSPGHSSPRGSQHGQHHQLALVPVQETQGHVDDGSQPRPIGVPYQMQDQYGDYQQDNGYGNSYQQIYKRNFTSQPPSRKGEKGDSKKTENIKDTPQRNGSVKENIKDTPKRTGSVKENIKDTAQKIESAKDTSGKIESERESARKYVKFMEPLSLQYGTANDQYANEPLQYTDVNPQANDTTLVEPSGYALKHKYEMEYGYKDEEDGASNSDLKSLEEGYASIYQKMKNKDPAEHPWYKVYSIKDYKKMQREVRLTRGTLGPDLDTEPYKEKMEKRHKQFEYARMVMEKNRLELGSKKPPKFPRETKEENHKRKTALDYAKNIPKPAVKPRPNQYNSYEVSAQMTPGGAQGKRSSPTMSKHSPQPSQTVDVIDIRTLEQRHLAERKNADKIRQNMDSVLTQKAA